MTLFKKGINQAWFNSWTIKTWHTYSSSNIIKAGWADSFIGIKTRGASSYQMWYWKNWKKIASKENAIRARLIPDNFLEGLREEAEKLNQDSQCDGSVEIIQAETQADLVIEILAVRGIIDGALANERLTIQHLNQQCIARYTFVQLELIYVGWNCKLLCRNTFVHVFMYNVFGFFTVDIFHWVIFTFVMINVPVRPNFIFQFIILKFPYPMICFRMKFTAWLNKAKYKSDQNAITTKNQYNVLSYEQHNHQLVIWLVCCRSLPIQE